MCVSFIFSYMCAHMVHEMCVVNVDVYAYVHMYVCMRAKVCIFEDLGVDTVSFSMALFLDVCDEVSFIQPGTCYVGENDWPVNPQNHYIIIAANSGLSLLQVFLWRLGSKIRILMLTKRAHSPQRCLPVRFYTPKAATFKALLVVSLRNLSNGFLPSKRRYFHYCLVSGKGTHMVLY